MELLFTVGHKVVGASRPKVPRRGKTYYPKQHVDAESAIVEACRAEIERTGFEILEGPVSIDILYQRKLPKNTPKRITQEDDLHTPDVDNVTKLVMDACTKAGAWYDDSQVVDQHTRKLPRKRLDEEWMVVRIKEFDQ